MAGTIVGAPYAPQQHPCGSGAVAVAISQKRKVNHTEGKRQLPSGDLNPGHLSIRMGALNHYTVMVKTGSVAFFSACVLYMIELGVKSMPNRPSAFWILM